MATVCKTWSLSAERKFQGLCSMPLKAVTGNNSTQCDVCVSPIEVACSGSAGYGTATWSWEYTAESCWSVLGWVLVTNNCECIGVPVPPVANGTVVDETAITDCERI